MWTNETFSGTNTIHHITPQAGPQNDKNRNPITIITQEKDIQINELNDSTREQLAQSYSKHQTHFDKKTNAAKLQLNYCCYAINPKTDTQASKVPFNEKIW